MHESNGISDELANPLRSAGDRMSGACLQGNNPQNLLKRYDPIEEILFTMCEEEPVIPYSWALAFGAGFGGNGTMSRSNANLVVTNLSESTRTPITSAIWNKRGLPVLLATYVVASILDVIAYPLFTR